MIKVVKAKYLAKCDSCNNKCTYLIRAGRKYLHVCTACLQETFKQCKGALDESQEQVEQ